VGPLLFNAQLAAQPMPAAAACLRRLERRVLQDTHLFLSHPLRYEPTHRSS